MKLFSLNLWRYKDFSNRVENILKTIRETDPDIICLQEVQIDEKYSCFSQVENFKKELIDYKYSIHSTILRKTHQAGKILDLPVQHGMAVLSKYPIINSFNYELALAEEEKERRSILCFDILIDNKIEYLANIHFGNREDWALSQLKEILDFFAKRKEERIMLGDFNLFKMVEYKKLYSDYKLSYDFQNYISLKTSYENGKIVEKNGTLDYVLIPENRDFEKVEIIEEYLSDHSALFAIIK